MRTSEHFPTSACRGHSLMELLIALTLLCLLMGLAVPSWRAWSDRLALRDLANHYLSDVQWARQAALSSGHTTTVCPSQDGRQCSHSGLQEGWIVLGGPDNRVLRDGSPTPVPGLSTHYSHSQLPLAFAPNGLLVGAGLRNTQLCLADRHRSASLALVMNQTGRVRWEPATNCP